MPLQKLQFRPGVNREGTTLANEGGWFESDKVRFRSGYPEKIGGWILDTGPDNSSSPAGTFVANGTTTPANPPSGNFWGICRAMWNWLNLAGYNLLAIGTNLKYYIQNGVNGNIFDITPIRFSTAAGDVTFTASTGSPVITVTDAGHGAQTGDFVVFSGAVSLGGNITDAVLNREYQITAYVSSNQYTITASVNATAGDSGNGGSSTIGRYQITTGNEIFTQNVGWGAGPWGGVFIGTTTTAISGGTLSSSNTTVTVTSTAGFSTPTGTILIESETITYTGTTGTTFTGCTRGVSGTPGSGAATTHANGTAVVQSTSFTGWGSPANTGIGSQLRLWSESNFGEDLVFNPRGGALYYWANAPAANTFNRGQRLGPNATVVTKNGTFTVDDYCPSFANIVAVSDSSRFIIAFGANDATLLDTTLRLVQNPMFVCWSDQERPDIWYPDATNQAGSYTLSHGSQIVTAIQTRQEILVITDSAIYSMQYLGPPYVWGFQLMGDNISIVGPNAAATANNVTYWMGTDKFYMYSGRVETLPCSLRQYVYNDINLTQSFQFFASTNEGYNEIWWFYCSVSGPTGTNTPANPNTTLDRYVIFNHLERTWYYGTMPRTYWLDSPLRPTPMSAGYNGKLIYQENGNDDGATTPGTLLPIEAYVQSSDFDIGDGHNFGLVTRIIPDVTFDGSTSAAPSLDFAVRPRQFPGTNYGTADAPTVTSADNYTNDRYYPVQQFTEQVFVRIRGRQMALKIVSNDLGVAWQLGVPRIDTRPDGRR
jgi:hypothetical protein